MLKKVYKILSSVVLSLVILTSAMPTVVEAAEHNHEEHECVIVYGRSTGVCPSGHTTTYEGIVTLIKAANSEYHWIEKYDEYYCMACQQGYLYPLSSEYLPHDMSGVASAPYRYRCIVCDYVE